MASSRSEAEHRMEDEVYQIGAQAKQAVPDQQAETGI